MTSFDIIADVHGQYEKLRALLDRLGWRRSNGAWAAPETDREIIFLGDFIDRGPDNAGVLRIVRELVDAGRARAIIGNHELNAIHFHTMDPDTGEPVKPHTERNLHTHQSFLAEHPVGSRGAQDAIAWFMTLPLWLDLDEFRVVHACWSDAAVDRLSAIAAEGVLPTDQLIRAGRKGDLLKDDVDLLTKGPEVQLPSGIAFRDGGGQLRNEVRLAWWRTDASTWRKAVVSVPNPEELPDVPLTEEVVSVLYPEDAKPLFFGHYWLSGAVEIESPNAFCLDYSAGRDGPLIAYRFNLGDSLLSLSNVFESS